MVEIAICLAVIAFALIAIIGILPTGMGVQKENREETIVDRDASVFINAIRKGMQGVDDLTNYVVAITNYYTSVDVGGGGRPQTSVNWYTYTNSSASPPYLLTNGLRIVGLLSTPKVVFWGDWPAPNVPPSPNNKNYGYFSNHIVAIVRSMSGPANEKPPQTNINGLDLAFTYRLISEVVPYSDYNTNWMTFPNLPPPWQGLISTNDFITRSNYLHFTENMQSNLYDLRLTFRWPQLPNGAVGPGRQVYRASILGSPAMITNDVPVGTYSTAPPAEPPNQLFFFQPSIFVQAPNS